MNWGSVPDWIAGFGTVGALFLGLTILRGDRANRAVSQASRVILWSDATDSSPAVYSLLNGSDLPLLAVDFRVQTESGLESDYLDHPHEPELISSWEMVFAPTLAAGETMTAQARRLNDIADIVTAEAFFIDANGLRWAVSTSRPLRRAEWSELPRGSDSLFGLRRVWRRR